MVGRKRSLSQPGPQAHKLADLQVSSNFAVTFLIDVLKLHQHCLMSTQNMANPS